MIDDVVNRSLGYFPRDIVIRKPGYNTSPSAFEHIQGESDQFVCRATNQLFKVADVYILDHLKKLVVLLGLIWDFVVSRRGASLRYTRFTRSRLNARKSILRIISNILCGCGWHVCFNKVVPGKRHGVDIIKITYICGSHTNTCDPSNTDQLVLARTRARSYKKCRDQILSEIMVRMGGSFSINVQSMVEVFRKDLPERKKCGSSHGIQYSLKSSLS